jgi:transcriptional regulator with XRE-family HTH domain
MNLDLELDAVPGLKNRIKELRERRGLTLEALEERSGIDHSSLSRLENGKMKITADYLGILAEALDFHPAEFIADLDDAARTDQEREFLDLLRGMNKEAAAAWLAAGRHLPKAD